MRNTQSTFNFNLLRTLYEMRYLITTNNSEPFLTEWFFFENHWNDNVEMTVYDFNELKFTKDGKTWNDIKIDHL